MNYLATFKFLEQNNIPYRKEVSGKRLTNLKIGGAISLLVEPDELSKLQIVVSYFSQNSISYKVIGAGSNLLIPDEGILYPVIKLPRNFRKYQELEPGLFMISAAMPLMKLSAELSKAGYSGLEFAGGIPASLGGAIKMNAGAHGGEMSEIVESVEIINSKGELQIYSKEDLSFSYRKSVISDQDIVISANLRLNKSKNPAEVIKQQQANLDYRKETQPLSLPSAGSIFKNPLPSYAGELIEKSGLKEQKVGGAEISKLHANWIVNESKTAGSEDVKLLILLIKNKVLDSCNIELESELVIW